MRLKTAAYALVSLSLLLGNAALAASSSYSISKPSSPAPAYKSPPAISKPSPSFGDRREGAGHQFTAPEPSISKPPPTVTAAPPPISKPPSSSTVTSTPPPISKPGAAPAPVASQAAVGVPRTAVDRQISAAHSREALQQFDAERNRFRQPPVRPVPTPQAAQQSPAWQQYGTRWSSGDDYWAARRRAEAQLPPQVRTYYTAPSVNQGPSAFGSFAAPFLTGALLGSVGTHAWDMWAYSHRTDDGYGAWHDYISQHGDAEQREKLAALDARVKELEAQHAKPTDALPDGVDPALVVAPETAMLATAHTTNWLLWIGVVVLLIVVALIAAALLMRPRRPRYS